MTEFDHENGAVVAIDKPYRWTSFDVIAATQKFFRVELGIPKVKIGHAGTLDPLATGLLILCFGKATKRIEEFMGQDKVYTGTFFLGATTPSFDLEKEVDQQYDILHINEEMILQAAVSLSGDQMQMPPVFSAIKVGGKRAYKSARKGKDVELQPRQVKINRFEITRIQLPEVDFEIECSKGTYIRAIARDFGLALNSGAYLSALRRTKSGSTSVEEAYTPEDFKEMLRNIYGKKTNPEAEAL
jgi:tRNA pseudouridine55 synthase